MANCRATRMTKETLKAEQATAIADLLPRLMRRLFTFDKDPVAELPLAQLRVCAILLGGPRPMSAISRELGISVSAMTQLADRLERARLVQRVAAESDRRIRQLQLTDRGEKMMRRREEARIERVVAALGHLSATGRQEVLAALESLLAASVAANPPAADKTG
jgi:DNA-binding MarR family transcriptional regulator